MKSLLICTLLMLGSTLVSGQGAKQAPAPGRTLSDNLPKSEYPDSKPKSYWKKVLSPETYKIMVEKGTETPFRNAYVNNHEKGIYVSAATGKPLFSSDTKFESGTGWPSFWAPIDKNAVTVVKDESYGMERDEIVEKSTGLHLGHVFNDGPKPSGLRYCMNSAAFKFIKSVK